MKKFIFICCFVSGLCSCASGITVSDLCGTYVADYLVAKEKLILDGNGTFTQEVNIKATSKVSTTKGKWSYDPNNHYISFDENYVAVLDGFGEFNPDYEHTKIRGSAFLPVRMLFGNIKIGVHVNEQNVLYKKMK